MASALRSFSRRRNISPKWFCKTSTTSPLVLHHYVKDYNTKPTFSDSSLLFARRLHRQVLLFEDRKKTSFAQQPLGASSGVLLCRHISSSSSKAEEWGIKIDAFGYIVKGLVPEKSVEAMAATTIDGCSAAAVENFSFPVNCVHYLINGMHDLTGCNWSMSIILTAFLVNELMSPVSMLIQRQAAELLFWGMSIQKVMRLIQTCDSKCLAKHKKWEAECTKKFGECFMFFLPLSSLDLFITISFINGIKINTMAKKIPGFTDLSTPDSFYILPLVTGLTYWLTRQATTVSWTNILFRMKELPWVCLFFLVFQAAFKYEPVMLCSRSLDLYHCLESCGASPFYVICFLQAVYIYLITDSVVNANKVPHWKFRQIMSSI
ncbi:mitochondrial inner membrane protein OXA1-like isoform X1 [Raphanus sativus]|uniref:Mitochondrial inner membrane protein OXA1-like isoform X1 n=1 Tax=Raphanus sativus TaxID=3726 RepID=A0A9W3BXT1_RAPSA|nr:mitochondrial inner membrane protein OXA1-like isoform X1 [Raphanus sativus]XP_056844052.1 mitochondrial inner membrane protein OXA1-like isoform X1 [Raphanus sativus]XP_056844053.1 mitochondrial inner membrane protein OXA1-like isoform X1 [Raphanus sativus]